jgi:dTDP-4-dehydrorhamnose reductase
VKALIIGATGQLARALQHSTPQGVRAVALSRADYDLADSPALYRQLDGHTPDVLINATAYTAVDQAESDPQAAFAANAEAVGVMAEACEQRAIKFVHVSTDYVFDGSAGRPYRPADAANPLSVYGLSKLEGERRIAARPGLDWRVIRTAWVYSAAGRNFVLTMLRLFRERTVVKVVADQVGAPTSADSLATCVWAAARTGGESGILHFTDAGVASWYDFAVAIYEEARALGLIQQEVVIMPIATEQYPTPARRPTYSVLDTRATLEQLGLQPVHWRTNLRKILKELAP